MEQQKDITKQVYKYCLYDSITSDTIKPFIEFIKDLKNCSKLDLYINSKGGVVPVAIGVYNFIKSINNFEVNTYNMGHCDSAATLLFMLGKKRYVLKNSSFFMHSLQVSLQGKQTITSLKTELNNLQEDTNSFLNILIKSSNIPRKHWEAWMNDKGTLIRVKKAISTGIATSIYETQT